MATEAPKKGLGTFDLTAIIVGSMVGSGIFFLPGGMLASLGSHDAAGNVVLGGGAWAIMLAWVLGAVIALCGGLVFAELGAAFPKAGGQYAFLRDSVGRAWGFLFSWTAFAVVQTGTIAAVAVALATAFDTLLAAMGSGGLPGSPVNLGFVVVPKYGTAALAIAIVWLLTGINYLGVRRAADVNNVATIAKLAAIGFIVLSAFVLGRSAGNFGGVGASFTGFGLGAFAVATSSSLFAYDGFAQATFVAAEVKDARRVLPKAILIATCLVAGVYLLATYAYFHVLPVGEVSQAALTGDVPIATESTTQVLGGIAGGLVASMIVVSTFGTVNAYVLASPRIYWSVARDREFPRPFGLLSRHGTPSYGLVYGAIWAGFLTLTGSYLALADLVVFGLYVFYLVTMVGYFLLRRSDPSAFDGFKSPLRPLPAILFGLASVGVLWSYLDKDLGALAATGDVPRFFGSTTMMAAILIGIGALVYWVRHLLLHRNPTPGLK
ncbi:MAG: basic amino acid/polyamine antiporter, family [Thermoplasmata archaeon]|jgi:APA family basic amino acid/polyamine antiporter|nr:basic amino acid/polyamine antiporter, family [Thermoplasmata archaeon]